MKKVALEFHEVTFYSARSFFSGIIYPLNAGMKSLASKFFCLFLLFHLGCVAFGYTLDNAIDKDQQVDDLDQGTNIDTTSSCSIFKPLMV